MAGMVLLPVGGSLAALFLFQIIAGFSYPGVFAIPQIIAGPKASGSWVGVQNAAGNVAGLIAPAVTGILVDQTGHFDIAFALVAGINVLGLIGWLLVLAAGQAHRLGARGPWNDVSSRTRRSRASGAFRSRRHRSATCAGARPRAPAGP